VKLVISAFHQYHGQMGGSPFKLDTDISYLHIGIGAGMRF